MYFECKNYCDYIMCKISLYIELYFYDLWYIRIRVGILDYIQKMFFLNIVEESSLFWFYEIG